MTAAVGIFGLRFFVTAIFQNNFHFSSTTRRGSSIKDYYNYKIKNVKTVLTTEMMNDMEVILHNYDCQIDAVVDYFIMNNMNCDSLNE